LLAANNHSIKLLSILELANDLPFEVIGLGEDPAVRTDDHAEGRLLAVAQDANGALARLGDDFSESFLERGAGAQQVVRFDLSVNARHAQEKAGKDECRRLQGA